MQLDDYFVTIAFRVQFGFAKKHEMTGARGECGAVTESQATNVEAKCIEISADFQRREMQSVKLRFVRRNGLIETKALQSFCRVGIKLNANVRSHL